MMEIADADELNGNPMHPYTLSLLSAVPIPDPETARHSKRIVLEGDVPSPSEDADRMSVPHQMQIRDRAVRKRDAAAFRQRQRTLRCMLE